jgi:hypothetical protein
MVTGLVIHDGGPAHPGVDGSPGAPTSTPAAETETASDAPATERRRRLGAAGALVVITGFGVFLRAHGFSGLGLWRDDAWVALSAKVGLGSAWHMWVTAPGAYLIDRTVLVLSPGTTTWAQLPAFVAGVAAIPAVYFLLRWFRLSRPAGLFAAGAICVVPFCVAYSTRVKEYELDILLACLVLALGEWARRTSGRRPLGALALASVMSFFCSASLAPVIAGVWLALVLFTWRDRVSAPCRRVLAAAAVAAGACGLVALTFYTHISPNTRLLWPGAFIRHSSAGAFLSSLGWTTWHLFAFPLGLGPLSAPLRVVLIVGWFAVMMAGLNRDRAMVAPALILAAAYLTSAANLDPLGTGRTDQYLYPALLLLTAAGVSRLTRASAPTMARLPRLEALTVKAVGLVVVTVLAATWVGEAYATQPVYPGVDVTSLVAQIHAQEQPGDHIFVSELMRYPWVLAEEPTPDVRFGTEWAAGFTVVSTETDVFIAPSEYYEGGSDPRAWAARETAEHLHRLWYVWSPPLAGLNPSYAALRADGWRPVTTLRATGCSATLLVRA